MIIVIQRVKEAKVEVSGQIVGQISKGLLVFLGIDKDDSQSDIDFLVPKLINLRIFEDQQGEMNLSAPEVGAEFLIVSQFTLLGDCKKGHRPSFDRAADPEKGKEFYEKFVEELRKNKLKVETGEFRAMMDVSLVNDGPVTFIIESK